MTANDLVHPSPRPRALITEDDSLRRVLRTAMRQMKSWNEAGLQLNVAVNISARNLQNPKLADEVIHLLKEKSFDTGQLMLEITESAIMANPVGGPLMLQTLHDLGVHIAIDDFGIGYFSLSYLKQLPVDQPKIDKSFVIT